MADASRDPIETVLSYHERTKHHPHRYARSRGFMDWENQPDPFRRYGGSTLLLLDEVEPGDRPSWDDVLSRSVGPAEPLDRSTVSRLFYDSLALSAWKEFGASRWALRVNPSSGNLHPTEGYLVAGPIAGLTDAPGVFHYSPYHHALERRAILPEETWSTLTRGLPADAVLVGLTSIHWREAWKYGERAYRYCQHDAGHAFAAVALAASALGWEARLVQGWTDRQVAALLGVGEQSGVEAEHADGLLALYPAGDGVVPSKTTAKAGLEVLEFRGEPNRLAREHHPWPVIEDVASACRRSSSTTDLEQDAAAVAVPALPRSGDPVSAREIFRRRRSAVAMDGETGIDADRFFSMLSRLLPGSGRVPFDSLPWAPGIHLLLFVHRVNGVPPGIYAFPRSADGLDALRSGTKEEYSWKRTAGCPEDLPLYLLAAGDVRDAAQAVSCHQEIASGGVFAAAMIAEFEPNLRRHGAWFYRALHWEAGAVGQVLYLEAEAAGTRGTGIGCFFDDTVHRLLGLEDRRFQDLYHFTVGGAIDDPRLRTIPAYDHRRGE